MIILCGSAAPANIIAVLGARHGRSSYEDFGTASNTCTRMSLAPSSAPQHAMTIEYCHNGGSMADGPKSMDMAN